MSILAAHCKHQKISCLPGTPWHVCTNLEKLPLFQRTCSPLRVNATGSKRTLQGRKQKRGPSDELSLLTEGFDDEEAMNSMLSQEDEVQADDESLEKVIGEIPCFQDLDTGSRKRHSRGYPCKQTHHPHKVPPSMASSCLFSAVSLQL